VNTQLDSFETRLLAELREHVAHNAPDVDEAERLAGRSARAWLAIAACLVSVAIGAMLIVPGLGSSPAYSVGEGNAGRVNVEINRPEDAAGLERALAERGINADITYLPGLQVCAPGRYQVTERKASDMMATIGETTISLTLPSDTVRPGETFVLTWSILPLTDEEIATRNGPFGGVVDGFSASVEFDVATGPVAPCDPIDAQTVNRPK